MFNKIGWSAFGTGSALLVAAFLASGCATTQHLFKPKPISAARLKAAGAAQDPAIRDAKAEVADTEHDVANSLLQYKQAQQSYKHAKQHLSAARRYQKWQQLKLERAQVAKELAQAKARLARAKVEAAEAAAIAQGSSGQSVDPDKRIDVGEYRLEVANRQSSVASLARRKANLTERIIAARKDYRRAEQLARSSADMQQNAPSAGEERQKNAQAGKAGTGSIADNTNGGVLQTIHPAGNVVNP